MTTIQGIITFGLSIAAFGVLTLTAPLYMEHLANLGMWGGVIMAVAWIAPLMGGTLLSAVMTVRGENRTKPVASS